MRATTKESTVGIHRNNFIGSTTGSQAKASIQDTMKPTTKQTTVVIPYQTVLTAVNQSQGAASTFDRTPLPTTMREASLHSRFGAPSGDTFGKGLGYLAEPKYARNTMKETTIINDRVGIAYGELKPRPYDDMYNADTNDNRPVWYRAPMGAMLL